jgi:hypothetical protein
MEVKFYVIIYNGTRVQMLKQRGTPTHNKRLKTRNPYLKRKEAENREPLPHKKRG